MTDNEIIKALGCFLKKVKYDKADICEECFNQEKCKTTRAIDVLEYTLDSLKHKNAEIERLKEEIGSLNKKYPCTVDVGNNCLVYARSFDDYDNLIGDISAEGIKEFADRLEYFVLNEDPEINDLKCKDYESYMGGANQFRLQIVKGINNLTKELTEKDTSVSLVDGHIEAEKGRKNGQNI